MIFATPIGDDVRRGAPQLSPQQTAAQRIMTANVPSGQQQTNVALQPPGNAVETGDIVAFICSSRQQGFAEAQISAALPQQFPGATTNQFAAAFFLANQQCPATGLPEPLHPTSDQLTPAGGIKRTWWIIGLVLAVIVVGGTVYVASRDKRGSES